MESKEAAANSKRRRGLGIITPNACTECRKKRAKCDGQTPCGRCVAQNTECAYEVPVRQSKETMRSEIEHLRREQQRSQRLLAALVSSDTSELVLEQLRNGETIENIVDKLDNSRSRPSSASGSNVTTFFQNHARQAIGTALKPAVRTVSSPLSAWSVSGSASETPVQVPGQSQSGSWGFGRSASIQDLPDGVSQEDAMSWEREISPRSPSSRSGPAFPLVGTWHRTNSRATSLDAATVSARSMGQETILGQTFGREERSDAHHSNFNQSWTTITTDGALVEHLMALYFCWEYPTFASLSKEHFLEDFRQGNSRRCSPLLVNALLALGCRFSNQPGARTDPNDSSTAGDHFFAEALRLLDNEKDRHVLTTVQALGLMSIREASCGRSSECIFYSGQSICLAVEMGLHQLQENTADLDEEEEKDHAVRAATFWGAFSLDQALSLSIGRLPHFSKDLNLITKPAIVGHVEASPWIPYTDDGAPLETSCSQPSNVRSVYKTFCELSECVHKTLYTLYAPGTKLTGKSLLSCYRDYLQWYDAIPHALRLGHNFTPAVLFAHMYYHFAILLLFRPFIKMEIIGSSVSPRDVCGQAAEAISALINSYSQLYTLQRTPSFVPYFVLTSCIAHVVAYGNEREGPEHLRQGIAHLEEMAPCHRFASRALDILYFLIDHWKVDMKVEGDMEDVDIKNMCRPLSTSLNLFCPNVTSADMGTGIGPVQGSDNPLFWPFPLQGKPILDTDSLTANGFKALES